MTTITSTTASNAATSANTALKGTKTTLDQGDFLKLMTAQMKNQDPFNPVDNTQMVAQMAQFSSLAGITQMSTTLQAISDKLGATTTADAVSYIGKTVLTPGTTAYARTSGGVAGAIELGGAASDVGVTITDANGMVLKNLSLGAQTGGTVSYDWNGRTDAGEDAGAGPFTVSVAASNEGQAVSATNLVWAPVQSVSTATGQTVLTAPGLGKIPVSAVRQIG
ncbi:flagellar hook assembly protein FlgD [Sphingomonas sp. HHU CXW]|uniref:Basal-body rod modification protein FlgD n=1 Tax=Sphingomonas hominis TaxID=2741495 RepID=A0ABX2JFN4_9SPHN|nr:flagellar hook capping FlgD N-terminal domain-containing protein [Sphingomonas hominis]NTS65241.1 flagellar hook assembly protein FlgD [Sphingomonas hominis]